VRAIRRRAVALLVLAVAGLALLAAHPPGVVPGPELDADTITLAGWAAWLLAGYLLLALVVAAAQCVRGPRGARHRLPLTRGVSSMAERWIGLTVAALAAATVSGTATPALAAGPSPAPAPSVAVTVPSLDWTQTATAAPATTSPSMPRRPLLVKPGDCLWSIAARELGADASHGEIARRWPLWWSANRAVIGPHPELIYPGQRLIPPASPQWRS